MSSRRMTAVIGLLLATACGAASAARAGQAAPDTARDVVILYTNDFHSAFEPIPAYWLPGSPRLGGAAALAGYVDRERRRASTSFLFDAGDMFTGTISNLTRGAALMEMMRLMRYDAMDIGNHEFDYGAENFLVQTDRVAFPVLGANIFYRCIVDSVRPRYSRPFVILERNGIRVGVIGVIGQDAKSVALQSGITALRFDDPAHAIAPIVRWLRPQVDLVVVLAHEGKTGPMETDAEAHPELQRDFDADIRLAEAVPGIDVLIGGHAHRGIEVPYVDSLTGTIIVQTYGYGTRLGYLKLRLRGHRVAGHDGRLIKVWTDSIAPDTAVQSFLARTEHELAPQLGPTVAVAHERLYRNYVAESPLGDFVADVMREASGAEIAFENAGGLRADIPAGNVNHGRVLDALPFLNDLVTLEMTGAQVRQVLAQSLTLERGMMQVSGIRVEYDLSRPKGHRLLGAEVDGRPLDPAARYRVATNSFVAAGGDLYSAFVGVPVLRHQAQLSDVMMDYLRRHPDLQRPAGGRLVPTAPGR
jgi:5'-nucleotidase/UDP-sugar diphosphatase